MIESIGPSLSDGYTDVPAGRIAAVATTLEMRAPPTARDVPLPGDGFEIRAVPGPDPDWYRRLFRKIGEPWLWHSRLRLTDAALEAIIGDENVAVFSLVALGADGRLQSEEGLLELDFREAGCCELAFFGVSPGLTGQGLGRLLMAHAVREAWSRPISRFWVHTCTLDHPSALGFYLRSGFVAVKRQIEIAPDPRLDGTLSPTAAPDVPLLHPTPK
ncbi:MAG: GNAT family N-acetyltransferase [Hyphomicrobiaceae bacterium]